MDDRDPRFDESKRDRAARLYREERLSEREVAQRMGCSKTAVRNYLRDAGVRRRRRSVANRLAAARRRGA